MNDVGTAAVGLWRPLWAGLRLRRWREWWLGPAGGLLVCVLALLFRTEHGHGLIHVIAITHARDSWPVLLGRLPLSMVAPAQMLPFAFAVLQVTVVFGVAQILLGWRQTLVVAVLGHGLATMSSRFWIWLGPPVGLPPRYLDFPDAGPSVAVVALIAFIAMERRLRWLAAVLVAYHVAEMVIFHGLSQREHLVGVTVGVTAAALRSALRTWRRAPLTLPTRPVALPRPAPPRVPAQVDA